MPSFDFQISTPEMTTAAEQAAGADVLRDLKFPLELDTTGDLEFIRGTEAISSDLQSRWTTFTQEWFLDLNMGIDYWGVIFTKAAISAKEAEYYREAMACPGIIGCSVKATQEGRELKVRGACALDNGRIFNATLSVVRSD